MKDKMLNMDLLIEQSKYKDGLYKSNILEEVSLTKEEIDKVRTKNYGLNNLTPISYDKDYNVSLKDIKNIYEDEKNKKFYVLKGDNPFTNGNPIIPREIDKLPIIFHPTMSTLVGAIAGPVLLGLAVVTGSAVIGGVFAIGLATKIGMDMYYEKNSDSAKTKEEIAEQILKQIDENKNQIDITSLFNDPYIDSFSLVANQKKYTNEYLVPEDLRKEIMSFEIKKENLSKGIKDITEIYEVLKSNPNTTKDDLVNIENELKSLLSSFNSDKNRLTNMISTQVDKYKSIVATDETLKETLKDINLMNHLEFRKDYEIAQLNSMITLNNDSKSEDINKAYGNNEISRIEGHVNLLALAISTGSIKGDKQINNTIYDISNKMKNFSELSLEEKKEVINNYGKLGDRLNSYIKTIDANSNLELNKDYINKEAISKLIEKIEKNELNLERNI